MRTVERNQFPVTVILEVEPLKVASEMGWIAVRDGEGKAGAKDDPSFERRVGFEHVVLTKRIL